MNILISGGYRKENPQIYKLMDKKGNQIAYVPSWFSKECSSDFKRFKRNFKNAEIRFFSLDRLSNSKINQMLSYDVIYIDGGNTFLLSHYLKKYNLKNKLKKFSQNKLLVGMSAGAIIQTTSTDLAKVPHFNADDLIKRVNSSKPLNLIDFEIYPHFEISDKKELQELIKHSKVKNKRKFYLLPDGSSIVVSSKRKHIGKFWVLKNGKISKGLNFIRKG